MEEEAGMEKGGFKIEAAIEVAAKMGAGEGGERLRIGL
jgi:hypothetical protein